jgi:hypothetical protein
MSGWFTGSHYIEVLDAHRKAIMSIRFNEAVELRS